MEAALRTANDWVNGTPQKAIDYKEVRGIEGVKEAVYKVGKTDLKVAAVSGLANTEKLLEKMKSGEAVYDFVEVMACPGGCVNGGGQSYVNALTRNSGFDWKQARAKALYDEDLALPVRKSHKNSQIQKIIC